MSRNLNWYLGEKPFNTEYQKDHSKRSNLNIEKPNTYWNEPFNEIAQIKLMVAQTQT